MIKTKTKRNMRNWVVLYHRGCSDGFGSACVVDYWYQTHKSVQVLFRPPRFIAVDPNQLMDELKHHVMDLSKDTVIKSIDVGFTKEAYQLLMSKFRDVTIIDHHISTFRELVNHSGKLPNNIIFDNNKAGCVLAWEFYFGKRHIPLLLLYLQDRDLYTFKEPLSKEINLALYKNYPPKYINNDQNRPDFEDWKKLLLDNKGSWLIRMIQSGSQLAPIQKMEINKHMKKARMYDFHDFKIITCYSEKHISDLGHELACHYMDKCHFAMVYRVHHKEEVLISLRSCTDFDCSLIANKYGGGGHQKAASFRWPLSRFRIIKGRIHLLPKH